MISSDDARQILSVHELLQGLQALVGSHYADVRVEGELSNFKRPASGHCYFTLKDGEAQVRCVMWRSAVSRLFFQPQDGMQVQINGQVSIYETRGDLQLIVRAMTMAGEGARQQAFEALKLKLLGEGLFEAGHKKLLPPFPESIGIITSGTGAALQDILSILNRRFPQTRALVCPVQVQGLGAAEAIADAIEAFNTVPVEDPFHADLLIVGRGGGSVEDLWAFNEEIVARAIYASKIPVVSAVGHETDISIADYVADVRAATPSMAAELSVPNAGEVMALVSLHYETLLDRMNRFISEQRAQTQRLRQSYHFNRPLDLLRRHQQTVDDLSGRLHRRPPQVLSSLQNSLHTLAQKLQLLDPNRPLKQGYALVERQREPIRSSDQLKEGDLVALRFLDGSCHARIEP